MHIADRVPDENVEVIEPVYYDKAFLAKNHIHLYSSVTIGPGILAVFAAGDMIEMDPDVTIQNGSDSRAFIGYYEP